MPHPTSSSCLGEDAHALAQALSKLAKGKVALPGGEFEEAATSTRVANELIVVSKRSRVVVQTAWYWVNLYRIAPPILGTIFLKMVE